MTTQVPTVKLAIGSRFENIDLVQVVVQESLRQLDLGEDASHHIGMAVREAVANAIQHGNEEDPGRQVEIEFGYDHQQVTIRVTDEGPGFDPETLPDPRAPENLMKPSGRGIFFMKNFMDEIDYSFPPEGGTVLTLRKRIRTPLGK